jgi:hypothetical protein
MRETDWWSAVWMEKRYFRYSRKKFMQISALILKGLNRMIFDGKDDS